MEIYNDYLVTHTDPKCGENTIDVFAFSLFVCNFIKGTSEDRVNMYSSFLGKTEDDVIPISNLQQVHNSLFSYVPLFRLFIGQIKHFLHHDSTLFNL